jgi:superfamily II DNA or RNA helicase
LTFDGAPFPSVNDTVTAVTYGGATCTLIGVKNVAGDYHEGQLSEAMQQGSLTADIVKTWIAKGEGRPTFCFAVDRAHAKSLVARFRDAGVACDYMDAETEPNEREAIRRRFHNGDIQVVVNIAVLTTGIDWDVRCIVFARPTKSEMLFVQIIGRGLRTAKGKTDLLILDHSDTTQRLGFVTDIHHTRLSGGRMALEETTEREKKDRLPKACKACGQLMAPQVQKGPACGFEREVISDVISRPGELVELNEFRESKQAKKRNETEDWPDKIDFIAQVRAYAAEYGKSQGWAAHKYRDRYGVWPNDPKVRYAPAASECGMEVRTWIKAMNMRWVKAQEKKRG